MRGSWLKLHRSMMYDELFCEPQNLKVWIWILCKAFYKEEMVYIGRQEVEILPGQFPTGRKKAAEELGMSESTVYRIIKLLQKKGCIDVKSNNKFSVITVKNWEDFQGVGDNTIASEQPSAEQQMNNKRTTNEQQMNTKKKEKNNKNINNIYYNAQARGRECVPTPKPTKFSNFTQRTNTDYLELERRALQKRIERIRNSND